MDPAGSCSQRSAKRKIDDEDTPDSLKRKFLPGSSTVLSGDESSEGSGDSSHDASDSEPDIECDDWDVDSKIITTKSMAGVNSLVTNSSTSGNLKPKFVPELQPLLLSSAFKKEFETRWKNNATLNKFQTEIIRDPFTVVVIDDFLKNSNFLEELRREFYEIDWNERNLDLYEFYQSKDLQYLEEFPTIKTIYQFLSNEVKEFIAGLTGYDLKKISATCSYYGNTDYLLVHDDQRSDRKVAFILYLGGNEDWTDDKGGTLQLLDRDEDGHPNKVKRDVSPINNRLVFFPVSNKSYHQVAEVTSPSYCRMSINGWFHATDCPELASLAYEGPVTGLYSKNRVEPRDFQFDANSWINEDYLEDTAIEAIQEQVEETSEICLKNFLHENVYNDIYNSLDSKSIEWEKVGPPNRYNYEVYKTGGSEVLTTLINVFQSKNMFALLHMFTGLDLVSMKFEIQKWSPGNYTLLSDYEWGEELDLVMFFGTEKGRIVGGRTQYVALDEEVQTDLTTVELEDNNLNLVYREARTARVTRYYSKTSENPHFYALVCSYSE